MISQLLDQVRKYHLSAPESFFSAGIDTLETCYNGIGPECWPKLLRKMVSELLQLFAAGALVHDFEFSQGEKSYRHFTQANCRLAWNCMILAFVGPVRLIRPIRKNRMKLALLGGMLGVLCQIWGYSAYKSGGKNV